jgi:hypothetical protein
LIFRLSTWKESETGKEASTQRKSKNIEQERGGKFKKFFFLQQRMPWCSKKYRLWLKKIPPLFFFLRSLFFDVIVGGGEAKNHCSCASLDK